MRIVRGVGSAPPAHTQCVTCGGTGGSYNQSTRSYESCSCWLRAWIDEAVPPRWRGANREAWVDHFGPLPQLAPPSSPPWNEAAWSITLLGPVGTVKTTLATVLFSELLGAGRFRTRTWVSSQRAVELVRAEINEPAKLPTSRKLYEADVLLLDDLGAERGTDFERDLLSGIITHRYNYRLPTILTSNARNAVELDDLVGARVSSRLCEKCETLVLCLGGADRRLA